MAKNPRASSDVDQGMIYYCGPYDNEEEVMKIGRHLLQQIEYKNRNGHMYYKSDVQTLQGTRATGSRSNSLYKIPVPRN